MPPSFNLLLPAKARCVRCGNPVPGKKPGNVTCTGCRVKGQNLRPALDRTQCLDCGRYLENLPVHLGLKHEMPVSEYLRRHPGAPIGMTGRLHSAGTRLKMSEARKTWWDTRTEAERESLGMTLKEGYASGRLLPARNNLGKHFSNEVKLRMSAAKRGLPSPMKGIQKGPMQMEVRQRISTTLKGRPRVFRVGGRDRLRESLMKARENGGFKGSGWGKGSYYQSPNQGQIWLRSTSEVQRAMELDAAHEVWFYEMGAYDLELPTGPVTYTPDFWILMENGDFRIEEVKGWWAPEHKDYLKLQCFKEQHPEILFDLVIRKGFVWGKPGVPVRREHG